MYLRKVGTDMVFAPTVALMQRTDMEKISDKQAKQIRVKRAKASKAKRTEYIEEQASLLKSAIDESPDPTDVIEPPTAPVVKSLADVTVDEPSYVDEGSADALDALLNTHQ